MVMTVLRDVAPHQLRLTLPHEHILLSQVGYSQMPSDPERAATAMRRLHPAMRVA